MLRATTLKRRRPSKATRFATLVGVTGAAVAVPVLGATSVSAATASEWDTVAQCESGGNWSVNTGNGFYGGLQFSASTWAAYGGSAYAATADQASKSQQIEIAEKVLAGQGKGAWPHCGVNLSSAPYAGGAEAAKPAPKRAEAPVTRSERPAAPAKKAAKKAEYKVKAGDTLSSIAKTEKVKGGWKKLYDLNKDVIKDVNVINPGQLLRLG
ncbi:transglycosylase family protein [Streptomyces sp. NPDC006208]|uniref:transglycosylase family protein n=1 Tax=Streptomyces sp. NPDC006208 TaxID=3156734 RepID=UPI0033A48F68